MTPLSHEILENYQVRKTKKQKLAFIELMKKHFPQLVVEESNFPKCRNLVIGNPDTAQVILGAHYDTCARSPIPNFIMPKRPVLSILAAFLLVIPIAAIFFLLSFLLRIWGVDPKLSYNIGYGLFLLFLLFMMYGPANKHTANDNTSGVITLCELIQTLNDEQKEKLAFVFFDLEEVGLVGSSQFRSKHKKVLKNKLFINFDCVSDGDHILVAASKKAREQYGERLKGCFLPSEQNSVLFTNLEYTYYPSDQAGFKTAVAVAALKHKPFFGYYMDKIHTSKDTVFEKKNITFLCDSILRLTKEL